MILTRLLGQSGRTKVIPKNIELVQIMECLAIETIHAKEYRQNELRRQVQRKQKTQAQERKWQEELKAELEFQRKQGLR